MKKTVLVFALILALLLAGCGAADYAADKAAAESSSYSYDYETPAAEPEAFATVTASEESYSGSAEAPAAPEADTAEKIIYTADLTMETTAFDETISALEAAVREFGGFTQDSSVSGDTFYGEGGAVRLINRYAYYTVRVPSEKLDAFLAQTGSLGNMTDSNKSATNITAVYADYARRQASLEVEEARLLELIAQAEKIEDLITLEDKLSDVRYEIESIQGILRDYDRQVSYSTVTLSIREVRGYRDAAPVTRSFTERIGDAFGSGWEGFVEFLGDFAVWFIGALFPLLLLAAVVVAVILIIKRSRKKKAAKKAPAQPPETEAPETPAPQPPEDASTR